MSFIWKLLWCCFSSINILSSGWGCVLIANQLPAQGLISLINSSFISSWALENATISSNSLLFSMVTYEWIWIRVLLRWLYSIKIDLIGSGCVLILHLLPKFLIISSLISFLALERVFISLISLFIWVRMLLWWRLLLLFGFGIRVNIFSLFDIYILWYAHLVDYFLLFYKLIYHVKKFGGIWTFLNFHACHLLNNLIQFVRVFAWYPSQRSSAVLPFGTSFAFEGFLKRT